MKHFSDQSHQKQGFSDFRNTYLQCKKLVDRELRRFIKKDYPRTIYAPARYVLSGGGKRIRPILVLLSCEAVGGRAKEALNAALAVEIFHNFTLVHDDIMDNASSRRGRSTVHKRWDSGTAILVGDALLGLAYKALMKTKSERLRQVVDIFTDGVVEVCEGQGYDKEFEAVPALPLKRYLTMIEKKTARLVALSAEIGALIGGGSKEEVDSLRRYGWHVGRAFQIQDDLLDIVGDEKKFGKRIGGDVLEGKKTYLLVKALELVDGDDRELIDIIARRQGVKSGRIPAVKEIYQRHGIVESANLQIQNNIRRAVSSLQSIKDRKTRARLIWFSDMLLKRGS